MHHRGQPGNFYTDRIYFLNYFGKADGHHNYITATVATGIVDASIMSYDVDVKNC